MKKSIWQKNLLLLFIFGAAMGVLESVVVVYLRHIYYPSGFAFPLKAVDNAIAVAEWVREICTIVMLLSVALLAGKQRLAVFSYFIYGFAVWDIFYYIGLKLFLDWPASLATWDILFLIPILWIGPVWAPVLCSLLMIILAVLILDRLAKSPDFSVTSREWSLIIASACMTFLSFIWDFGRILAQNRGISGLLSIDKATLIQLSISHVPQWFNWPLFTFGMLLTALAILRLSRRTMMDSRKPPHESNQLQMHKK
jgi:hypothetical protein